MKHASCSWRRMRDSRFGFSWHFRCVDMATRAPRLDQFAVKIQVFRLAVLRPRLLKPTNVCLRLNPESPQSQNNRAHGDDGECSGSYTTTMGASNCALCDSPRTQNLLKALLKPLPQIDDRIPRQTRTPRNSQVAHELREPGLASFTPRHQRLARSCSLSGERIADQRPTKGRSACIGMLALRCRCVRATAFLVLSATAAWTGIITAGGGRGLGWLRRMQQSFNVCDVFVLIGLDAHDDLPAMTITHREDLSRPCLCLNTHDSRPLGSSQFRHRGLPFRKWSIQTEVSTRILLRGPSDVGERRELSSPFPRAARVVERFHERSVPRGQDEPGTFSRLHPSAVLRVEVKPRQSSRSLSCSCLRSCVLQEN